jgi:hypothetical protein
MRGEMSEPDNDSRELQAIIEELATNSAELSELLHGTVTILAELLAERSAAGEDHPPPTNQSGLLDRDVLEIATLQAEADGVSVEAFLREAVMAYADGDRGSASTDDRARRGEVRERARRMRADSKAVKAQTAQAAARAAQLEAQARATQQTVRRGRDEPAKARPRDSS